MNVIEIINEIISLGWDIVIEETPGSSFVRFKPSGRLGGWRNFAFNDLMLNLTETLAWIKREN